MISKQIEDYHYNLPVPLFGAVKATFVFPTSSPHKLPTSSNSSLHGLGVFWELPNISNIKRSPPTTLFHQPHTTTQLTPQHSQRHDDVGFVAGVDARPENVRRRGHCGRGIDPRSFRGRCRRAQEWRQEPQAPVSGQGHSAGGVGSDSNLSGEYEQSGYTAFQGRRMGRWRMLNETKC